MTLATAIFQYMAILHHGWLKPSTPRPHHAWHFNIFQLITTKNTDIAPKRSCLVHIPRQAHLQFRTRHISHSPSMTFKYLQFRTPHIDSLFASSLTLPSFYTSSPVCIRIALFSGLKIRGKNKRCAHPRVPPSLLDYPLSPGGTIYVCNSGISYPSDVGPQLLILEFAAASILECSPLETLEAFLHMFQLCPLFWGRGTTPPCFLVICTIC